MSTNKTAQILLTASGILLVVAVGRWAVRQMRLLKEWDFSVTGLVPVSLSPLSVSFNFNFINKSGIKTEIRNIVIDVYTDSDIKLGRIEKAGPLTIVADGISPLAVTITADKAVTAKAKDILKIAARNFDLPMHFVGRCQLKSGAGWVDLPIRHSTTGKKLYDLYRLP